MSFFEDAALRLKQQLKKTTDKGIAEDLGLSQVAWVGRKKRGNFPEKELYTLAAKRPDLNLDVDYVLTGIPGAAHAVRDAADAASDRALAAGVDDFPTLKAVRLASKPTPEETALIADWRKCSEDDQALLISLAASLAGKRKPA